MDQEERMDFKTLRAKFQDEELFLKQPRMKPALPEKPKVVPPPHSPTQYLPAGARPSLLTSINQSLENKSVIAPRVVFKNEKKESKMPLIQGKLKKGKDKTKESKEKLSEDSPAQKQKKESSKDKKGSTEELVPAPPPKSTTGKKGFLGFRKISKRGSVVVPADSLLDSISAEGPGQAPLIPVPTDFVDAPPAPEISRPRALLPNIPTVPHPVAIAEMTPPLIIPASPDFTPPPAFIPDVPKPERETPQEIETPDLPVPTPYSINEPIPSPPSIAPTPPPSFNFSCPPPMASTPPPSPSEVGMQAEDIAVVETPPPLILDPPSIPPSPKAARPISALSVLERAEMNPGKKTSPCDQRIVNALEKARRKSGSMPTSPTTSLSITPPSEEPQSSTFPLPPIDYEDKAKPAQVNGFDHGQAPPLLEGIAEEGSESIPEVLAIPSPPPRKALPDLESLGPAPQKPGRPPFVDLSRYISPPPVMDNEILTPTDLSELSTSDFTEIDDVASEAQSPELTTSDWGDGEFSAPDTPDGQNLPEFYSNGMLAPGAEVHAEPVLGEQVSQGQEGLQAQVDNGVYESAHSVYETISASGGKKKGKPDLGKKRKGPPKNPYAEAPQETSEEKSKTIKLFNKNDKKAAAEGPDEKELKKREKQRLEKEKKELKERQEKEKKEQKDREKKENEMKKKFKITGQEDAMYEAKVTVTTKGRKSHLPVKSGDVISIIRTTNCPKGKWLAKDSSNNYGYVEVDHVELDIKEMLEMGKKAVSNHKSISNAVELDVASMGSRVSNHYPVSPESYDSEEWTGDDEEPASLAPDNADSLAPLGHTRTLSMPEMVGNKDLIITHQHSHSDIIAEGSHVPGKHEALQKLATFFHSSKPAEPAASSTEPVTSPVLEREEEVQLAEACSSQEVDFDLNNVIILPPPELYADSFEE